MATNPERQRPAMGDAVRRVLARPLASYQLVLGVTVLLTGLGLIMVLSASSVLAYRLYDGNSFAIAERQALFAIGGAAVAFVIVRMPLSLLRKFVLPMLIVSVLLICLTYVPGIGIEVSGNRNWLPLIGGFQMQPSEFAKLALILWMADMYSRRQHLLGIPRYILMPMVLVVGVVTALVIGQGDLGTALILAALMIGMLWVVGLPARHMWAAVLAMSVVLVFFVATAPHRVARMLTFLDPMSDPEVTGYQVIHGMMALARGGFWGVGLGGSRQKWGSLPEAHTDFILAVVGEELGLIGTLVVLGLFIMLVVAGVRIATRSQDPFAAYIAAGITIWIAVQAIVNIGMVLNLLPVIGVPLPLISYGGSSLAITLAAMAILLNCAKTEPGAQRALAAGKARRADQTARRK